MSIIKLYVVCHEKTEIPASPLLFPIQVGAECNDERFEGFLYDDSGENISKKNKSYCELTAQFWAWKNDTADYYGFFHYRRFLVPIKKGSKPYYLAAELNNSVLEKYNFSCIESLIEKNDIVCPLPEDMHISVREHYYMAEHHNKEDLLILEGVVKELYPEYAQPLDEYFSQSKIFFGNIFVMRQDIFFNYCPWLFSILEEFDRRADWTKRTAQELRVDGYLAERLLGVYVTKHAPKMNIIYLPRVHFEQDFIKRTKRCVLNKMLPPGTKHRATIKRIFRTQ